MDFEETLLLLDGIEGSYAIVYPAAPTEGDEEPRDYGTGFMASGLFRRNREGEKEGASMRRRMSEEIEGWDDFKPEVSLGGAPLESYERQVALFTFEGMDADLWGTGGYAGFSLWRYEFRESRWLSLRIRPDWLWIRTTPLDLIIAADFPGRVRSENEQA